MVFRMELTYSGNEFLLDMQHIVTSLTGYTRPRGIFEIMKIVILT